LTLIKKEWKKKFDVDRLGVVHMNNSAKSFKSRVDRHACLQHGHIDFEVLNNVAKWAAKLKVPIILETPGCVPEITILAAMISGKHVPQLSDLVSGVNLSFLTVP
jgi:endonuclease IV